jgi:nucleotide-binding universal stress UspA family protein
MIEINKILVATDFSEGSEAAYPVAQKIASAFGSKIDFIHVIPTIKYLSESMKKVGAPLDMNKDIYPKIIQESEHLCAKAMSQYILENNSGEYFVKIDRKPSDTIVEHAEKNEYDMIIMGSRGKHGTRMLRGSTTEKVIRHSKIPVFSVDESVNENKIDNIVIPTDTSRLSLAAFPFAVLLADTYDSSITLLHIIELYGSISEEIPRQPDKGEMISIYEVLIERLNNHLADAGIENLHIQRTGVTYEDQAVITEGDKSRTIPLFTKIEKGVSAHYEIERFVEDQADLVVIATHGHSGLAHLILGSTAEKVAQYVSKPVITLRPDKKLFKN